MLLAYPAAMGLGALLLALVPERRGRWLLPATLLAAVVALLALPAGQPLRLEGGELAASPYLRLWLLAAAVSLGAAWATATLAGAPPGPRVLAGLAGGLALVAPALAAPRPAEGLALAVAGGAVALAGLVRPGAGALRLARDLLRDLAAAGMLALLAVALLLPEPFRPPELDLVAGLALVGALALRLGLMPLHGSAIRLAESAPLAGPVLIAWLPAAFVAALLGWHAAVAGSPETELAAVRLLLAALCAATIVLSGLASLAKDDLRAVAGYAVLAELALAGLVFASTDAAALSAARGWLLLAVVARSGLFALVLLLEAWHGTRRLPELNGWARVAPASGAVLLLALAAILAATLGWPGSDPFAWRLRLAQNSAWPLSVVALLGVVPLALAHVRLAWHGLRRPAEHLVADVPMEPGDRPPLPPALDDEPAPGPLPPRAWPRPGLGPLAPAARLRGPAERLRAAAAPRLSGARAAALARAVAAMGAGRRRMARLSGPGAALASRADALATTVRVDGRLPAALAVLVLALMALGLAAGYGGLAEAARMAGGAALPSPGGAP